MEERVANLPKRSDLDAVRNEALIEIEKLGLRIDRALEKHEAATREGIRTEVTKTVEAAFNLQWAKVEALITAKLPPAPKRDWVPIIAIIGMGVLVGFERLVPYVMKMF